MRCINCDTADAWKNVDEFRIKKAGMAMCGGCGMISYPDMIDKMSPEGLKEFYRKEYRKPPTVSNLYSGQRKLQYHAHFLQEVLAGLKQKKAKVFEIGSAYGLFLRWLKKELPDAELSGSELTLSFRRNAWHEFGIKLDENFIEKKDYYDLICSYKVAEHQIDFDQELLKYRDSLKGDGLLYISVPTWFETLHNFGMSGFDIEYYYHTNHINVWTKRIFEGLLSWAGFKIVKQNHSYYDNTYLCVKTDRGQRASENTEETIRRLAAVKKASGHMEAQEFEACVNTWPRFPFAWHGFYEQNRAKMHRLGFEGIQKNFIEPMLKACPGEPEVFCLAGDIAMRYNQWVTALSYLDQALGLRPDNPATLTALSQVYRNISLQSENAKDKADARMKARDLMRHLKEVSFQSHGEAISWIYADNAEIPAEFEM